MLDVRRLSKVFFHDDDPQQPGLVALYDVSFTVRRNEFVSVLGPSGCGKTTLLRIIAGLTPADRGDVLLNGTAVSAPGRDRGFVFQHFGLLPWRTALANVEFGLEIAGVRRDARRRTAREYLDLVGLTGFERHYPHQLSGGMQQRVGLARALSIRPDVLLMDEPFASLDAQTREQLQEELSRIWSKTDTTVLFVTHSLDEAIYLSDRVIVMQARPGRIREDIAVELPRPRWDTDVKADPRFARLRARLRDSLRGGDDGDRA